MASNHSESADASLNPEEEAFMQEADEIANNVQAVGLDGVESFDTHVLVSRDGKCSDELHELAEKHGLSFDKVVRPQKRASRGEIPLYRFVHDDE